MLLQSVINLAPGWFTGTGVNGRQFVGPNSYFSMEGFPPEAYTMLPSWEKSPEVQIGEQEVATSVAGSSLGGLLPLHTEPDVPVVLASMNIAQLSTEVAFGASMQAGGIGIGGLDSIASGTGFVALSSLALWMYRLLGISLPIAGVVGTVLDIFSYGRVFVYYKREALGSMPPELAQEWIRTMRAHTRRGITLRMEGQHKNGRRINEAAEGITDDVQGEGKSPWEKINPFDPDASLGDKLNPFVRGPMYPDDPNLA